jgi:chemotaxis protein MotB
LAKKQKCPEFENHERWLVSFADMMTLLFALFVVLFSLKDGSDSPEIEQAAGSINETFGTVLEDVPIDRRVGPTEAGLGIFEHFRGDQIRPPLSNKFPGSEEKIKVIDEEFERVKNLFEERLYGPDKVREPDGEGSSRVVSVQRSPDGFNVRLLATHFYDSGGYRVRKEALKELDQVATILKELGKKIIIEGHTDNVAPTGGFSNWDLSALRASNVLHYFVAQHDYPKTLVAAAGYGDTKPIAHNGTTAGRRLNRRIEIRVLKE